MDLQEPFVSSMANLTSCADEALGAWTDQGTCINHTIRGKVKFRQADSGASILAIEIISFPKGAAGVTEFT